MSANGIFIQQADGGIAPASAINGYTPAVGPAPGGLVLYYPSGCGAIIRGAQLNAIVSELLAVVDGAGLAYDITKLDNVFLAIKQLILNEIVALLQTARGITLVTNPTTGVETIELSLGLGTLPLLA